MGNKTPTYFHKGNKSPVCTRWRQKKLTEESICLDHRKVEIRKWNRCNKKQKYLRIARISILLKYTLMSELLMTRDIFNLHKSTLFSCYAAINGIDQFLPPEDLVPDVQKKIVNYFSTHNAWPTHETSVKLTYCRFVSLCYFFNCRNS